MMRASRKKRGFQPLTDNALGRITFHGAAGEVTGSCYLLETPTASILVECGMFQGGPREAGRNRRPLPFDPTGLDAVLVTHAHIDHTGLLPKLRRDGYHGPIHATQPTCDLLRIMLPDAVHIQEQEAAHRTRKRRRRGSPPLAPLYTVADAQETLEALVPHAFDTWIALAEGIAIRYRRNGHILGAAALEVCLRDGTIARQVVFSGDIGRRQEPMLLAPDPPTDADLVIMESTYGDRDHKSHADSLTEFAHILTAAAQAGENVIVPVFAVGRAQEILHTLGQLEQDGRVVPRPVYLDSPMAIHVTALSRRHAACFQPTLRTRLEAGEALEPASLQYCQTPEESKALNAQRGVIILAASGMCEAGRVVHHLKHHLWRSGTHVVIVGFQTYGTTGRALVDGARRVRILGEEIAVQAQIHTLGGFSAHAGQTELLTWVTPLVTSGAQIVCVHGEADKRAALAARLQDRAPHPIRLPLPGDCVMLCKRGAAVVWQPAPRQDFPPPRTRQTPVVWQPVPQRR